MQVGYIAALRVSKVGFGGGAEVEVHGGLTVLYGLSGNNTSTIRHGAIPQRKRKKEGQVLQLYVEYVHTVRTVAIMIAIMIAIKKEGCRRKGAMLGQPT